MGTFQIRQSFLDYKQVSGGVSANVWEEEDEKSCNPPNFAWESENMNE